MDQKTAVIYEVPHLPEVQAQLLKIRDLLRAKGMRVVVQNPAPYRSEYRVPDAAVCYLISGPITAHAGRIALDYKKAGADIQALNPEDLDRVIKALEKPAAAPKKPQPGKKGGVIRLLRR